MKPGGFELKAFSWDRKLTHDLNNEPYLFMDSTQLVNWICSSISGLGFYHSLSSSMSRPRLGCSRRWTLLFHGDICGERRSVSFMFVMIGPSILSRIRIGGQCLLVFVESKERDQVLVVSSFMVKEEKEREDHEKWHFFFRTKESQTNNVRGCSRSGCFE